MLDFILVEKQTKLIYQPAGSCVISFIHSFWNHILICEADTSQIKGFCSSAVTYFIWQFGRPISGMILGHKSKNKHAALIWIMVIFLGASDTFIITSRFLPSGDSSCTYVPVKYRWTKADFPLDRFPTMPCKVESKTLSLLLTGGTWQVQTTSICRLKGPWWWHDETFSAQGSWTLCVWSF